MPAGSGFIRKKNVRFEWYGDKVAAEYKEAIKAGLAQWADELEQSAKSQLAPGAGVLTKRMQKSIHAASPSHNWESDFHAPPRSAPELGNLPFEPEEQGSKIVVAVGTGVSYAAKQENRYRFIGRAWDQTSGKLIPMLEMECKRRGLGKD